MIKKNVIKLILDAYEAGMTKVTDVCSLAGVSCDFYYDELKRNPAFGEAVESAKMKRKLLALMRIRRAGEKSWQAEAWTLERTYGEEFAVRGKFEMTGKGGRPLLPPSAPLDLSKITDAQLKSLIVLTNPKIAGTPKSSSPHKNGNGDS